MNCEHFKHSPKHEYPTIELDVVNFMEHLSDEFICGKTEVRDDGEQMNPKIIDCKTEDYINLEQISSISGNGLEREEKVRKFDMKFVVFHHERFC